MKGNTCQFQYTYNRGHKHKLITVASANNKRNQWSCLLPYTLSFLSEYPGVWSVSRALSLWKLLSLHGRSTLTTFWLANKHWITKCFKRCAHSMEAAPTLWWKVDLNYILIGQQTLNSEVFQKVFLLYGRSTLTIFWIG